MGRTDGSLTTGVESVPARSPYPTRAVPPDLLATMFAQVAGVGLTTGTGIGGLLDLVLDAVTQVYGDAATVWLDGRTGAAVTATGHPPTLAQALRRWPGRPAEALVASAAVPEFAWLAGHGVGECVVVPIAGQARQSGLLLVTRAPGADPFTPAEVAVLTGLAAVCATVLIRTRMLEDSLAALEDAQNGLAQPVQIADALIVCDPTMRIISWNPGAEQIYGYPSAEALDCELYALLATTMLDPAGQPLPDDARVHLREALDATGRWRGDLRQRRADGTEVTVSSSVSVLADGSGVPMGLVAVNRDISDQHRERHNARHDALTGLPNRRVLAERLGEAVARCRRSRTTLAVLFLDLDGFKPVNDTHGHTAGDIVLTTVAHRLAATVRETDLVARLGGDEFVVVLEDVGGPDMVTQVVRRIRAAIAEPVPLGDTAVAVTATVGVAVTPTAAAPLDSQALLDAADQAMYTAKHTGTGVGYALAPPAGTGTGGGTGGQLR